MTNRLLVGVLSGVALLLAWTTPVEAYVCTPSDTSLPCTHCTGTHGTLTSSDLTWSANRTADLCKLTCTDKFEGGQCKLPPCCTGYTYSVGACQPDGTQTLTVTGQTPAYCTTTPSTLTTDRCYGKLPAPRTSQSCTYTAPTCSTGYTACGTTCYKTAANAVCSNNTWTCNSGYTMCNGTCYANDPNKTCSSGTWTCKSGYTSCGGTCYATQTNKVCSGTSYVCKSGYTNCGGTCYANDPAKACVNDAWTCRYASCGGTCYQPDGIISCNSSAQLVCPSYNVLCGNKCYVSGTVNSTKTGCSSGDKCGYCSGGSFTYVKCLNSEVLCGGMCYAKKTYYACVNNVYKFNGCPSGLSSCGYEACYDPYMETCYCYGGTNQCLGCEKYNYNGVCKSSTTGQLYCKGNTAVCK